MKNERKTNQTKQERLAQVLSGLSSAYQEEAIESTAEDLNDYEDAQKFADDCCEKYRHILTGAGYYGQHIYEGFRDYGDECELQSAALEYYAIAKESEPTKKSRVVLFEGCFENKRRVELYNFSKIEHTCIDGKSYIRIECDGRFYYFKTQETTIASVEVY